jgi:DivIVA domain-containing protein
MGRPRRVPAEIRNVSFPVSARGYDRRSVDAYIIRLNRLIAELEATLAGAVRRHALEEAKEQNGGHHPTGSREGGGDHERRVEGSGRNHCSLKSRGGKRLRRSPSERGGKRKRAPPAQKRRRRRSLPDLEQETESGERGVEAAD